MSTLIEIQKQIKVLEAQANQVRAEEMGPAIQTIKETMALYGITAIDLGFGTDVVANAGGKASKATKATKVTTKAEIKYRDANGNGWSGRGLKPRWLTAALAEGRALEEFLVTAAVAA